MFDVAEEDICSIEVENVRGIRRKEREVIELTEFLFGFDRRLISNTVRVDLNVSSLSLSVERRSQLNFGKLDGSFTCEGESKYDFGNSTSGKERTLDFDETILLDNVCQFLPLSLTLDCYLLEIVDFLVKFSETERIDRAVGDSSNESCVGIFERLIRSKNSQHNYESLERRLLTVSSFFPVIAPGVVNMKRKTV